MKRILGALCLSACCLRADGPDPHAHDLDPIVVLNGTFADTPTFGAGIVFSREKDSLYIVTANHVVRAGGISATNLSARLRMAPGKDLPVKLSEHFNPALDLAVLSISNLAAQGIDPCSLSLARLALPGSTQRGDNVFPVGNPNGVAWARPVRPDAISDVSDGNIVFESSLIARGHSGGGLLNDDGLIVGLIQADEPPYGRALGFDKILHVLESWGYVIDLAALNEIHDPPLIGAVASGDIAQAKRLLARACADPNIRGTEGYTLLEEGLTNLEMVKLLVASGADVKRRGNDGPIIAAAAQTRKADVVRFLLSQGAPCCGYAPFEAAENGNLEVLKALVEGGANVNAKDRDGDSLLHVARSRKQQPVVDFLLQHGALDTTRDKR